MSELIIIRPEDSCEALRMKIEARPGPAIIPAGGADRNGRVVRMPSGQEITAGGELLKMALRNGGVIVAFAPDTVVYGPSVADQKNEAAAALKARESFVGR
jgi:hypothetical protein